eukprot:gene28157-37127_t
MSADGCTSLVRTETIMRCRDGQCFEILSQFVTSFTDYPTIEPTDSSTDIPSLIPTYEPSYLPTLLPTYFTTKSPSNNPTAASTKRTSPP